MTIPILNIYYLLSYAWDRLEESELVDISALPSSELVDLFARVLGNGVSHALRRGLDRGYISYEADIPAIRGKLQIAATEKRALRRTGRAVCAFDELSYDISSNQIIKATLRTLLRADIDPSNRALIGELTRKLKDVEDIRLTAGHFRTIQIHRNNSFYGFLLQVCALIYDNLLPDEKTGKVRFRDFVRDKRAMALLFQEFVFNFLRKEQTSYSVSSPQLRWYKASGEEAALKLLPIMRTDIVLADSTRSIIIDTKFYSETLQSGQHKETFWSHNVYQLYAYMRNMQALHGGRAAVEGVLLYPTVGSSLDVALTIDGHRLRVRTVDLSQPWQQIRQSLLALAA
jgi:5-methylcytosine-specific restriction enzyme subunit McrC